MLKSITIDSKSAEAAIAEAKKRLEHASTYYDRVVRPDLLRLFGVAYRRSGIGIVTGRLHASFTNPSSPDHISQVSDTQITVGSRVPYAVYVEKRKPIAGLLHSDRNPIGKRYAEGFVRWVKDGRYS